MKVKLLHYTPLLVCANAIRTCWQSFDKSDNGGEKDKELIDRVGNKYKHASTLEHLNYSFYIEGVSRALLQEFARHRMASLSVKSTRYTLKELKEEPEFTLQDIDRAKKYLVFTNVALVDEMSIKALENLRKVLVEGISNDKAKYCLPESYKTELTWSINARSLQNFLRLRSSKSALWEIRKLAMKIYDSLPQDHKYLFEHCIDLSD
ncbi:MAG: FAD-dependent thymidylate synthase [Epsilonproteobacteria bacterium]|nr:FAD-dependent thymidylate synthase [Campylobacterota bacterium]